ncbi:hypothetical protein L1987_25910 [Smallanthus sonchifolius]|uniref:Uncharacterized protein n=1 Tax=Smallanthus sonchifolius TaxID=185202 RepID=A0ACB9I9P9_9ASTR|nr:hypothetical protein L1987_25910 [Smallanthus sonchifolius]
MFNLILAIICGLLILGLQQIFQTHGLPTPEPLVEVSSFISFTRIEHFPPLSLITASNNFATTYQEEFTTVAYSSHLSSPLLQNRHKERHFYFLHTNGLTVPSALAAGLSGANASSSIILTASVAEVVAGAISMGLGG